MGSKGITDGHFADRLQSIDEAVFFFDEASEKDVESFSFETKKRILKKLTKAYDKIYERDDERKADAFLHKREKKIVALLSHLNAPFAERRKEVLLQRELIGALRRGLGLEEAVKDWDGLSMKDKKAFAEKAAGIFCGVYGLPEIPIELAKGRDILGQFEPPSRRKGCTLVLSEGLLKESGFGSFCTVIHELAHYRHNQAQRQELEPRELSEFFKIISVFPVSGRIYIANPDEIFARRMERKVAQAMTAELRLPLRAKDMKYAMFSPKEKKELTVRHPDFAFDKGRAIYLRLDRSVAGQFNFPEDEGPVKGGARIRLSSRAAAGTSALKSAAKAMCAGPPRVAAITRRIPPTPSVSR